MRSDVRQHEFDPHRGMPWLPWWYRPSRMFLGASLPALLIFSFSDSTLTLSRAPLFYGPRDLVVGLIALVMLIAGAFLGESRLLASVWGAITSRGRGPRHRTAATTGPAPRLAEALLSEQVDRWLLVVFLVAHVIFFRNFITSPGLIAGVLGGNVELKHTFKTIPGVTTWTQVSLVLGALRGLRWSGILPGRIKLISLFHLAFFGTLFVRAILWSERLAMIEGAVPFFVCALPRVCAQAGPFWRLFLRLFPFIVPIMLLVVFTAFESLRSWGYYSSQYSSVFEFGWRRLYTYYFEAMNTGAAALGAGGFYDGPTGFLTHDGYESIYQGLYQGTLDLEYNNVSGLWYVALRMGNLLFGPVFFLVGVYFGLTWRGFVAGRLSGLLYPITFLGLMEVIRIPYWAGLPRVLPTTVVIIGILIWGASLPYRMRKRRLAPDPIGGAGAVALPPAALATGSHQYLRPR